MNETLQHQTLLGGANEGRRYIAAARGLFWPHSLLRPDAIIIPTESSMMAFDEYAHVDVSRADEYAYATFLLKDAGAVTIGIMGDVDFIQLPDRPMPTIDQVPGIVYGTIGALSLDQSSIVLTKAA